MTSNIFSDSQYMKRIVSMAQGVNAGTTFIPCKFCKRYLQVQFRKKNYKVCAKCVKHIKILGIPHKCPTCGLRKAFGRKLYCGACALKLFRSGIPMCHSCHFVFLPRRSSLFAELYCSECQG